MEKLELKHLAPYLPYRIKVKWYRQDDCSFQTSDLTISDYPFLTTKLMKPILRPLSDLKNYITVDGEEFCPMFFLDQQYATLDFVSQAESLIVDDRWLICCDYGLIQHLFEWHFDVFGLIEKGLAIDINTIKTT